MVFFQKFALWWYSPQWPSTKWVTQIGLMALVYTLFILDLRSIETETELPSLKPTTSDFLCLSSLICQIKKDEMKVQKRHSETKKKVCRVSFWKKKNKTKLECTDIWHFPACMHRWTRVESSWFICTWIWNAQGHKSGNQWAHLLRVGFLFCSVTAATQSCLSSVTSICFILTGKCHQWLRFSIYTRAINKKERKGTILLVLLH